MRFFHCSRFPKPSSPNLTPSVCVTSPSNVSDTHAYLLLPGVRPPPHQRQAAAQPAAQSAAQARPAADPEPVSEQVPPVAARQPIQPPPHRPSLSRSQSITAPRSASTDPPPVIIPRTSSSSHDRHERAARRNSAPIDRIQLRPLPPPPLVRLDAIPPPPVKTVSKKAVSLVRPNLDTVHLTSVDITPPNVVVDVGAGHHGHEKVIIARLSEPVPNSA